MLKLKRVYEAPSPEDGKRINIVAHSLGCYLVLQALEKRPDIAANIRNLILMAAAARDDSLNDKATAAAISKIDKVHIFFSRNDDILKLVENSHGLGLHGPKEPSSLPSNVVLHYVTKLLDGPDVHGQYLRKDGLSAISLMNALD